MEKYYCVFCGEEILPKHRDDKLMISLSYAALDGATESLKDNTKVYVTKGELSSLINRRDEKGRQYIKLDEFVQFAYNERNERYLMKNRADNAKAALDSFFKKLQNKEEDNSEESNDSSQSQGNNTSQGNNPKKGVVLSGFNETVTDQLVKNFLPGGKCYVDWTLDEKYGYGYRLHKEGAKERTTKNWLCSLCGEQVLDDAFQYRHVLIGVLGRRSAGKTCMIAAMCHRFGGYLQLPRKYKDDYEGQLDNFINGYSMAATKTFTADNTFHPSIVKDGILWTTVDIPGERFYGNGDIDFDALVEFPEFKMSLKCHTFILTMEQDMVNDNRMVQETFRAFSRFIDFANRRHSNCPEGAPMILAITKVDSVQEEDKKGSAKGLDHYPKQYRDELFIIRKKGLQGFVKDLSESNYLFPVTCAPYGFPPCPQDDPAPRYELYRLPETKHKLQWRIDFIKKYIENHSVAKVRLHDYEEDLQKLNMDELEKLYLSELKKKDGTETIDTEIIERINKELDKTEEIIAEAQTVFEIPHPIYKKAEMRNIDVIISWLKKLYGVESYTFPKKGEEWEPRDISAFSINDLHEKGDDVRRIAYMFVNPTESDIAFVEVSSHLSLIQPIETFFLRRKYAAQLKKEENKK